MFNEKLLKISILFIAVLIVTGLISINLLTDTSPSPSYTSSPKKIKASNTSTDAKEVNLDTIFITIRSNHYKILKADFAFKMKNEKDKKALEKNMESVRSATLQYIASRDSQSLSTQKGKDALMEELISMIKESFGYEIETIYIKNFILSP